LVVFIVSLFIYGLLTKKKEDNKKQSEEVKEVPIIQNVNNVKNNNYNVNIFALTTLVIVGGIIIFTFGKSQRKNK